MPASRRRLMLIVAVLVPLILGGALTYATMAVERRVVAARFDRLADLVSGRLQERMIQYVALLQATRAYFEAEQGEVTAPEFASYIGGLNLGEDYPGIQGIGLAPLLGAADAQRAAERIGRDNAMPSPRVAPSDQSRITPIALLEPQDARNRHALGFDMFSEPIRRQAMLDALDSGEARASAPVELVQEITTAKQPGFLIFLPTRTGLFGTGESRDRGFVYAPFRAGDLHEAVMRELPGIPLTIETMDADATGTPLFDTMPDDAGQVVSREINVAGRRWLLRMAPTAAFGEFRDNSAGLTVALLSLLLFIAVLGTLRSMSQAVAAAEQTAALAASQAEERRLLLREMQHRIKNHIARIQAIARQTLRGATDLADFDRTFGARLAAMAKAQDALGRDEGGTADLRELIQVELAQIMAREIADSVLDGPEVRLDARAAQAMGLVAHELATNTMKYGSGDSLALSVRWRILPLDGKRRLVLTWSEPEARPPADRPDHQRGGFGTQLIEALIEGDLQGSFDRMFDENGMTVHLSFPLPGETG